MRGIPIWDSFAIGHATAAGGTAFASIIPPYRFGTGRTGAPPKLYKASDHDGPNWFGQSGAFTRINSLIYTSGATAHKVGILQPLNWTTFAAAVAKNSTAITLSADPGKYSTNYRFPTSGGAVPSLADNTIAANDYVAYQLDDGTWRLDTIASGTFAGGDLVLTTGTANVTGATIAAGNVLFFFGVVGDTVPATGAVQWQSTTTASQNRQNLLQEDVMGGVVSVHKGSPLVFYSPNGTNAGVLDHLSGIYSPR